ARNIRADELRGQERQQAHVLRDEHRSYRAVPALGDRECVQGLEERQRRGQRRWTPSVGSRTGQRLGWRERRPRLGIRPPSTIECAGSVPNHLVAPALLVPW